MAVHHKKTMAEYEIKGLKELADAVRRNPANVIRETGKFLVRGLAVYRRIIFNNPWRMGMSGGGSPVAQSPQGGHLRQTHVQEIGPWEGRIRPTATYTPYVHGIEGWPRKRTYQLRPWLDYAKEHGEEDVKKLEVELLNNIAAGLAA